MHPLNTPPNNGQYVIAYVPGGTFPAQYRKVLTWKGYKHKFVNLLSKGFWRDDVIGWNRIPKQEETI